MTVEYINLNGLTNELGVENLLMNTGVWELYLAQNFKINIIRSLKILKDLLVNMNGTLPSRFSIEFGDETVSLIADFRIRDKSVLIDFDGGV